MSELDYYAVKAVSNSGMGAINPEQGGSPARYKKYVIDRDIQKEETPSLRNGTIIHKYIENPDSFIVADITKPSEMMCSWVESYVNGTPYNGENLDLIFTETNEAAKNTVLSFRTTQYKAMKDEDKLYAKFLKEGLNYLKFLRSSQNKFVIDEQTKTIVEGAIAAINSNPDAQVMLFQSGTDIGDCAYSELPIYWTEEVGSVELDCKALLDRVRIFPETCYVELVDSKTTSKPASLFHESFRKYRYYRQLAFYKRALEVYLKSQYPEVDEWEFAFYIVVIETTGIQECLVYDVDQQWIDEGEKEWKTLIKEIAYRTLADSWTSKTVKELNYDKE